MIPHSAVDVVVPAQGKAIVQTDIAIAVPDGTYGRVGELTVVGREVDSDLVGILLLIARTPIIIPHSITHSATIGPCMEEPHRRRWFVLLTDSIVFPHQYMQPGSSTETTAAMLE